MLNVGEGVAHIDSKSKILLKSSVLQTQNVRFTLVSLLDNTRSASSARSVFRLPQNARPAFCQLQNTMSVSLVLNTRPAFYLLQSVTPAFLTLNTITAF